MKSEINGSIIQSGIDEATARWLTEEAERRGVTAESLALEILREGVSAERDRGAGETFDDLTDLAGHWDKQEVTEFLRAISDFEHVDEQLWR
jgi:hypothetical protein